MEEDVEMMDEVVKNFNSDKERHNEGNKENMPDYNTSELGLENIYIKLIQMHILKKGFIY